MMDYKLALLFVFLLVNLTHSSTHKKGFHKRKVHRNKTSRRQQIFQQNNGNPPVPPIGKELQNQLREQVNADSGGLVEVSPTNSNALNGMTGEGIGLPFGTPNRRIDKNPLIGANGLTKSSLADIMFGNLKGLARVNDENPMAQSYNDIQSDSVQGGDMRQMVGGQMDGMNNGGGGNMMGNILNNAQPMNLNALAAMNNLAGSQGLNAFGARNGAMGNILNGGNMNDGNMNPGKMNSGSSMGLNGMNPNVFGNPALGVNSFGGPLQPNPLLGMQMMSQLSNMNEKQGDWPVKHHKRHHKHKKNHNKSTTKLLLSLLVDKLRDIYELDQMKAGNKKLDSSTSGKIGLTLDDLGVPKADVHHGKENNSDPLLGGFKTKLSFPVTISDSKAKEELKLTDDASRKNFEGKIPADDDDAKIQQILSGLGIKDDDTAKKTNSNNSKDSLLKDIQTASDLDSKAKAITSSLTPVIKGHEVENENAKTRDNIEEVKIEDKGSMSEFHRVNMSNDLGDELSVAAISGVKSDVSPSELANFKDPHQGEVTAPEIFSVSSLLNNGIPDPQGSLVSKYGDEEPPIHDKSLGILGIDASKKTVASDSSNEKVLPYVPSDINTEQAELKSLTDTIAEDVKTRVKDGEDYVKAARVLGAVFNKVKDPVAKKSIETAIKAMLQVMKNAAKENNNSSKKHQLPSDDDEKLVEQIQRLNGVYLKMKGNNSENKEKRSSDVKIARNSNISLYKVVRRKRYLSKLSKKH